MDKKRVLICSIIFYCLTLVLFITIMAGLNTLTHNYLMLFTVLLIIFFISATMMMFIFVHLKNKESKTKPVNNSAIKARTSKEIFNDKNFSDYDKYVEWCFSCDEDTIKTDKLLLGAYQVMWLFNEVCNGGFDQFFDYARDWDMEETSKLFEWLLPKEVYDLFTLALQANKNDEDCSKLNYEFDYDLFEEEILPSIAEKLANHFK